MSNFPIINYKIMVKYLKALGFSEVRQKGSHKFFRHKDGRTTTLPCHKGEDLGKGITIKILKDIESNIFDFIKWYGK